MTKAELSAPNRWLVERCQHINFGSITFHVRGGEPDLRRPHSRVRTLKIAGGFNGFRPEVASDDFELRREHIALFERLKELPDGTRVRVRIAHGLPGASVDLLEDQQAA
ncbi:MAG: hypothetical protein HZB38_15215 [Planctomycetes bacterium]|nr:hypothetical protein [Planctomycetota bacterium]